MSTTTSYGTASSPNPRNGRDEDFLSAYRRVGMAPFKKALYERTIGQDI